MSGHISVPGCSLSPARSSQGDVDALARWFGHAGVFIAIGHHRLFCRNTPTLYIVMFADFACLLISPSVGADVVTGFAALDCSSSWNRIEHPSSADRESSRRSAHP